VCVCVYVCVSVCVCVCVCVYWELSGAYRSEGRGRPARERKVGKRSRVETTGGGKEEGEEEEKEEGRRG